MSRTLAAAVYLSDPEGQIQVFGAGSIPPDWAAAKITNPNAWNGHNEDPHEPAPQEPDPQELHDEPGEPEVEPTPEVEPPPVRPAPPPKRGGRR